MTREPSDLWRQAHAACNSSRDDMWDWLEDRYLALVAERDRLAAERDEALAAQRLVVDRWDRGKEALRARAEAAEARADRLAEALREIAEQDPVELALDPQWSVRIARAVLAASSGGEA